MSSVPWKEQLAILENCDPKWLAEALFFRQESDPILNRLCKLKIGIEKAKTGDVEALRSGLEAALDFPTPHRSAFLDDEYDMILNHSTQDLELLQELPNYEECIRPLFESFISRAAFLSTEFEEGFGWMQALEELCTLLKLPVPDMP